MQRQMHKYGAAIQLIPVRIQDALLEIAIEQGLKLKRTWAYICRRDTERQSSLTLLPRSQSHHSDGRRQQVAEIRSPEKSTQTCYNCGEKGHLSHQCTVS